MGRILIKPRQVVAPPAEAEEKSGGIYFSSEKEHIRFIRSGCALLDCVLGGGWPLGRVANIVGDKSTGKTLLAIEAVANLFRQYPNAKAWYNEPEAAFDLAYAQALGVPFERVEHVEDCMTVEDLFEHLSLVLEEARGQPGLYILDSLDALSDKAERERGIEEGSYGGAKAKKLSELFRRLTQDLRRSNICLMVISQVRDNIGVSFGDKHSRSGGRALDFYAAQALWLAYTGVIKRVVSKIERPTGVKIKAKCKKNKVGLPFRECEFEITFGYGIEDEKASRAFLQTVGILPTALASLQGEALRSAVLKQWFRIEKSVLPARRKYSDE